VPQFEQASRRCGRFAYSVKRAARNANREKVRWWWSHERRNGQAEIELNRSAEAAAARG